MINRYLRFAACITFLAFSILFWVHSLSIIHLRRDVKQLNENNIKLIRLNEALSKGVGDVADSIIQKSEWDKKVATNIFNLNEKVNQLYGQTNQGISGAVRGVQ